MINIAGKVISKTTLHPGWKWSKDVQPLARTEWCEVPHFFYQISGRFRIKMRDGDEFELKSGDVAFIPSGHDAWVVGHEDAAHVDWFS